MSNSIKPEKLQKALMEYLTDYCEDIQEDVEDCTDKVTKEARKELVKTSPRDGVARKTKYYKGWSTKISKRGATKYHKVIWNKTNYQLTHLLEFGHVTRNGGRTKAQQHIRPIEEKYNAEFIDLVEERIRRRSKR